MLSTTADVGNRQVSADLVGASFYLRCVRCSWEHHWGGRFHCPTSYNCPDHSPSSSLHRPSLNKHATRNDEIINIDNQGCTIQNFQSWLPQLDPNPDWIHRLLILFLPDPNPSLLNSRFYPALLKIYYYYYYWWYCSIVSWCHKFWVLCLCITNTAYPLIGDLDTFWSKPEPTKPKDIKSNLDPAHP